MYYKLTNQKMQTHGGFQWKLDKWYEIPTANQGQDLCSNSWFHCYDDSLLAVLLNPIHTNFKQPRLFELEVDGDCKTDNGLKFGFTRMKLVKELPLPEVTMEQRVKFAILCTLQVYSHPDFIQWADAWLTGRNRSAADAADAAAAADAADAAAAAAYADAADAADVAAAADAAAAYAAADAADAAPTINLKALAKEALS